MLNLLTGPTEWVSECTRMCRVRNIKTQFNNDQMDIYKGKI